MWLGGIHTPEAVFHGCGFVGVLVQVLEAAPPGESGWWRELGSPGQTEPGLSLPFHACGTLQSDHTYKTTTGQGTTGSQVYFSHFMISSTQSNCMVLRGFW